MEYFVLYEKLPKSSLVDSQELKRNLHAKFSSERKQNFYGVTKQLETWPTRHWRKRIH